MPLFLEAMSKLDCSRLNISPFEWYSKCWASATPWMSLLFMGCSSTTCVSLIALHTLGHIRCGRVLPTNVCHHVIVVFLFVFRFLFWSSHIPWLMTLWQRPWIIQHQGAWHEYALWDKFLSATRHKLDSYSSWSIISTNLSATIFAMKHTCQTCKTSWVIW